MIRYLAPAFAAFALTALAPVASLAADVPDAPKEKTQSEDPAEKKVCRLVQPTGSIMKKRACMTAAEWQQLKEQGEANAANLSRRRGGPWGPDQ